MPVDLLLLISAAKAALLVAAALALVGLARRASAAMRHAVLFAAMAGALLLPLLAATLPAFSPVSLPSRPAFHRPAPQHLSDVSIALVLVRSDAVSQLPVRPGERGAASRRRAILAVWLLGTAVMLYRIVRRVSAARRTLSRAMIPGSFGPGVRVVESAEIDEPLTVGFVRPAILLPMGSAFERETFRWVIAHELRHIERRDCLTQLVARLACAVYWFNPLVWRAAERIALEQERACDDGVLASGADPIGYSELLIDVARRRAGTAVPLPAAPAMARPAHLERRIVGILDASAPRVGVSRARIVALALATCAIVAPLASFAIHDRPPRDATSDPYLDPQTERVPGVRELDPSTANEEPGTADGALITKLRGAAAREPEGPGDLVPDRARWALSQVGGGRIIEPVIEALQHPDWRVRGYAAWALAVSGDPRGVEPLLPLLDHPVWRLRAMAAYALRAIGDPSAAQAMTGGLKDPSWQVRIEAVAFLGALRDPSFRGRIEPLRNDPHLAVRLAADEALSTIP
jgi:beta-lactamase regulating signal transducer with metallopeptidase domain